MAGSKIGYLKGKMGLKGKMKPGQMLTRMNEMKGMGGGFNVVPQAAKVLSKAKGLGFSNANNAVKEFIKGTPKEIALKSPAFKNTVKSLAAQKGATTVGALGMGTVLGAGAIGAGAIYSKGKQVNKEIDKNSRSTVKQGSDLIKNIRAQRLRKKQLGKGGCGMGGGFKKMKT
jgi:hypothetical protein